MKAVAVSIAAPTCEQNTYITRPLASNRILFQEVRPVRVVPTMVTGNYGMNFRYMPELSWPLGYPLALAGMAAICLVLYLLFRRSGWL